jgi:thiamine-monophosphate kinase
VLVRDIGEFGLIDRIAKLLPSPAPDVVRGIGDDVAVLKTGASEYLLATCDIQVEGVHFLREAITPYQLGRKAVAINVSDIAAMGGEPRWALVSLAIPEDTEVGYIEELYRGLREEAAITGTSVVGGNLSRMESRIAIDITLLGAAEPEFLVLRSGARTGDAICVTGFPGESRAGLELIRRPDLPVGEKTRQRLLERHLTPHARLKEGRLLARSRLVTSMLDVSDGLLADLGHICESSGTGAELGADSLPVSGAVTETAAAAGTDALDWVLSGGEDYELLFTAGPKAFPTLKKMLLDETGTQCTMIGTVSGETGVVRLGFTGGKQLSYTPGKGWDHFAGKK